MVVLKYLLGVVGLISVIYCFIMLFYSGPSTAFLSFFIGLGICCVGGSFVLHIILKHQVEVPRIIKTSVLIVLMVGLCIFAMIEGLILLYGNHKPKVKADYLIVLGAQVRGTRLTKSLRYRLDAAIAYLKKNPNTKVIVSGGQGPREDITEAKAMKRYLISKGIHENSIIMEEKSTNTYENLMFSKRFMKDNGDHQNIVIVTNKFHLYRAVSIGKKQGLLVWGLGAKCDRVLAPSYYIREFFAVVKYKLSGVI